MKIFSTTLLLAVFTPANRGDNYSDTGGAFKRAATKAGMEDFRFHDLRHDAASRLVMNGVDIQTVQEILGHKTLAMTMRYSHLSPSHKLRAVLVLDRPKSVGVGTKTDTSTESKGPDEPDEDA